jgi:hypothetical protein
VLGRVQADYTHVSRCEDGSFCCGKLNTTCCSDYSGIHLNEAGTEILKFDSGETGESATSSSVYMPYSTPVSTSFQIRISTPASAPTTSETSQIASATSAPSSDKPKEGLDIGSKVGIGVGVPAIAIAAVGVWLQCMRK